MSKATFDEADKATALKHARRLADRAAQVDREMEGTILLCRAAGASLREIAEATDLSHMTVKRTLERTSPTRASSAQDPLRTP